MDHWLRDDPVLLSVLFLALPLLYFAVVRSRRRLPFPPGPRPLPIIGNMLIMDQFTHRGLAKLAEAYSTGLLHLRLGIRHTFVVCTPGVAREVLQVQDASFANRPATAAIVYLTYDRADMAFAHYGPFWRQMRKLCVVKLFSRKRPQTWDAVRDEVDALVSAVARSAGFPVNLGELISALTMNITFKAAFGTAGHDGQQKEFIRILQEFSKLFGAFNISDFLPWMRWLDLQGIDKRLVAARNALDRFIDKIIDEHVEKRKKQQQLAPEDDVTGGSSDMVDDMLDFLPEHRIKRTSDDVQEVGSDEQHISSLTLTRNNIKAIIMDVMFGGTETVASAIEWAMAELLKRPDELRRLHEELAHVVGLDRRVRESDLEKLPFLRCVVKETLRLHPPIPLLLHETAADCVVDGYAVPKRSRIMINVFAINRDSSAWTDPDAFRPARFMPGGQYANIDFKGNCFELLPFGSGRRSCPGMLLGLYALEHAVAEVVHCFNWSLPDGMKPDELDMSDVFGLTAPRAVRLSAVATPRLTCSLS